jgi:NAD(P)-dependent dehydrogenase (short-subunit alcohol dehydrogenase family)
MNKTALVTGASAGIGEATVKRLLADGYIVYAAARRMDRMAPLAAAGARLIALDLTDDASIIAAVERIRSETGRLDVLVNNAGYGSYGALEDVPLAEARRQFEVNLFGAARLIQLALPIMRKQKSGKIVNVSSVGGKFGGAFGAWYHATKHALEGLSDSLRVELIPFGIDVIVIEPGAIRTEWGDIALESLLARSGDTAYGPYVRRAQKAFKSVTTSRLPSPPEVVANIIAAATRARRPRTRYPAGGGAPIFLLLRRLLSDRMMDRLMWRLAQGNG